jgi:hypothetical protein
MATNITAITASAVQDTGVGLVRSFRGLFKEGRPFEATLTDATSPAQGGAQCDVTVAGAALGDFVLLAGPAVDTTGLLIYASVTAANTVTITTFNVEGTDANTTLSGGVSVKGIVLTPDDSVWTGLV